MLLDFPLEILDLILDQISEPAHLKTLCEVSKRLNELATPRLYENINIEKIDYPYNDSLDFSILPLLRICYQKRRMQFVRSLRFRLPREKNFDITNEGCPHGTYHPNSRWYDPNRDPIEDLMRAGSDVRDLLYQLKDHSLHTFSWNLNICIPRGLLTADGYLAKHQSRVRSLSLVTDNSCRYASKETNEPVDLTSFSHLRDFSWKGIGYGYRMVLAEWLYNSEFPFLETLELGFVLADCWGVTVTEYSQDDRTPPHYEPRLATNVFFALCEYLIPEARFPKFPALKYLSLEEAWFTAAYREMACYFNFSNLHTLKLRNCPNAAGLLHAIVKSGIPIQLTTFEFSELRYFFDKEKEALILFLKYFRGLEQFYLDICDKDKRSPDFPQAIAEHSSTLKYVTYHVTTRRNRHCVVVRGGEPASAQQGCKLSELLGASIFAKDKLECFSFGGSLTILKPVLHASVTLKVLHMPTGYFPTIDGIDKETFYLQRSIYKKDLAANNDSFLHFVYWAFTDGLPGLEYLSYGDFSDRRFGYPFNVILCRDPSDDSKLKVLRPSDELMHRFKRKYGDFLRALSFPVDD